MWTILEYIAEFALIWIVLGTLKTWHYRLMSSRYENYPFGSVPTEDEDEDEK